MLDILVAINKQVQPHLFYEFSVLSFKNNILTIAGSDDFCYYHNMEIHFHNVFSIIGNLNWRVRDGVDCITLMEGNDACELNRKYHVEIGNSLFKMAAEDDIEIIIIAESISFENKIVKYYSLDPEIFHSKSIRGRYLYGYCCLLNAIKKLAAEPIHPSLDIVLRNFMETDRLDIWHEQADEFKPSDVLGIEFPITHEGVSIDNNSNDLIRYYAAQPVVVLNIIEELLWLGISNLYGGFKSEYTVPYILQIITYLKENDIELPDDSILTGFPITENGGWGRSVDLNAVLHTK